MRRRIDKTETIFVIETVVINGSYNIFELELSPLNRACKTRDEKRLLRQEYRFLTAAEKMAYRSCATSIDQLVSTKALGENRAQVLEYL